MDMSSERQQPVSDLHSIVKLQYATLLMGFIVIILVLLTGLVIVAKAESQAQLVSSQLARISVSLDNLRSTNRSLESVDKAATTLQQIDGQFAQANERLTTAADKLDAISAATQTASGSLNRATRSLTDVQDDIHTLTRKVSGSFLFRSVK